jgi:hypothetical protein
LEVEEKKGDWDGGYKAAPSFSRYWLAEPRPPPTTSASPVVRLQYFGGMVAISKKTDSFPARWNERVV